MLQRSSALKANKPLQDLDKGLTQSHTRMQEGLNKTRLSSLTSKQSRHYRKSCCIRSVQYHPSRARRQALTVTAHFSVSSQNAESTQRMCRKWGSSSVRSIITSESYENNLTWKVTILLRKERKRWHTCMCEKVRKKCILEESLNFFTEVWKISNASWHCCACLSDKKCQKLTELAQIWLFAFLMYGCLWEHFFCWEGTVGTQCFL